MKDDSTLCQAFKYWLSQSYETQDARGPFGRIAVALPADNPIVGYGELPSMSGTCVQVYDALVWAGRNYRTMCDKVDKAEKERDEERHRSYRYRQELYRLGYPTDKLNEIAGVKP